MASDDLFIGNTFNAKFKIFIGTTPDKIMVAPYEPPL
jgi:hypothetical protein